MEIEDNFDEYALELSEIFDISTINIAYSVSSSDHYLHESVELILSYNDNYTEIIDVSEYTFRRALRSAIKRLTVDISTCICSGEDTQPSLQYLLDNPDKDYRLFEMGF